MGAGRNIGPHFLIVMDDLQINTWLVDKYGRSVEGLPYWRVVWTTNLTEKRNGKFREHTTSGIFLREVTGVQEVLKYPYDKDRWVLEQLVAIDPKSDVAKELVQNSWSYEPFYVFKDNKGKFLALDRDVIDVILYIYYSKQRRNRGDLEADEVIKEAQEREYYIQKIGEMQSTPHLMDLVE